jgi:hypothetical protein
VVEYIAARQRFAVAFDGVESAPKLLKVSGRYEWAV